MSRFEIKLLDVMVVEGQGLAEGDFELQVKAILHPGDKAISWPDIADDPKAYRKVPLIEPLARQLKLKKSKMEEVLKAYASASEAQAAEVTTAATFHTAALYQDFGKALIGSQRPKKLSKMELGVKVGWGVLAYHACDRITSITVGDRVMKTKEFLELMKFESAMFGA